MNLPREHKSANQTIMPRTGIVVKEDFFRIDSIQKKIEIPDERKMKKEMGKGLTCIKRKIRNVLMYLKTLIFLIQFYHIIQITNISRHNIIHMNMNNTYIQQQQHEYV
jgi:hypothetical protein